MLGRLGDGIGQLQRIIDGDLHALEQGIVQIALVDIIIAYDVGDKHGFEEPGFKELREIRPIVEILVFPGAVARMTP